VTTLTEPVAPALAESRAAGGGKPTPAVTAADRLASVDALRGVVMFTMLFVNDVAGVRGVPGWMKHYPASGNGMTFVDWVFGGFLFIVGLSIPLAFQRRLECGDAMWRLGAHVIARTAGLLLLGVFMVNGERDPTPNGWPPHLWEMLVYLFGILAFLAPPGRAPRAKAVDILLRIVGFAGFVLLAAAFRDATGNGMHTSWWGILGLIGWAYLVAAILYLVLKKHRDWMIAAIALLTAMYLADKKGAFNGIALDRYVDFGAHLGSHAAITMAGVVLGAMLHSRGMGASPMQLTAPAAGRRERMGEAPMPREGNFRFASALGAFLALGAWLLYPLHGINKNAATPSWCLICAAITTWLWAILSLLIDRLGIVRPFAFFIRGGQNVLLAYLLMPLFLHFIWMTGLGFYGKLGSPPLLGVARALVSAAVVLWLAGFLKDRGLRLRL
jgi:predicted acyltransferase